MGILKAAVSAVHSVKEELWQELYHCDTMTDDTILLWDVKGEKHVQEVER